MRIFLSLIITALLFTSCSKKSPQPQPINPNKETINGTDYPVIKISGQTWTSVNYNGTGGVNYNEDTTNDPKHGKLYTLSEAKAIQLPAGWRLPTYNDFAELVYQYKGKVAPLLQPNGRKI